MQLLLTFSETNLLDFSESASPAAPLAAEAAYTMAPDLGVLSIGEWIFEVFPRLHRNKCRRFSVG